MEALLREGQRRGLLGPGPIDAQMAHAIAFGEAAFGEAAFGEAGLGEAGAMSGPGMSGESGESIEAGEGESGVSGGSGGSSEAGEGESGESGGFSEAGVSSVAGDGVPGARDVSGETLSGVAGRGIGAGLSLDLGSGGGLPGLVLAAAHPESRWTLLDSRRRSADFLRTAVEQLGLAGRVAIVEARAEDIGRSPGHRGRYHLVTARGFGPPAVTAECAAPLLAVGGRLVVSEPPGSEGERWPKNALELLGLRLVGVRRLHQGGFAVLEQASTCPDGYPRRSGVPAKRPLFVSRETSCTT